MNRTITKLQPQVNDIENEFVRTLAKGGDLTSLHAEIAALGLTRCDTCIDGCNHGCDPAAIASGEAEAGSCGHWGCWGPDGTSDCAGVGYVDALYGRTR